MATITANTYLDSGTARTAGEAWTCNGGILTIRTDSRWHANAPASMTGSLGSLTISSTLGGGYYIDGTKVRWLQISGGSGSAAIGTTITQGGVSGYFLGFYATITSAPSTTIGATGFIKLREVTGGTFSAGALSGITATAVGADKVGWIEVVHDQSATITVPRLGKFQTRGDWFELGTTNGTANQVIQLPTNGSSTTYAGGVWIETSPSSGTYEYYPSLAQALMTTANLGTDRRSKFVGMNTTGGVTIGGNGTVVVGYLPPSGCKVRIPNILLRQCTTAARATNAIPHATVATRPEFATTSAGAIDIEITQCDWYLNLSQPYSVRIHHASNFDACTISECATALDLYEFHSDTSAGLDVVPLTLTSNFAGGMVENCRQERYLSGTNDHSISASYCKGITYKGVTSGIIQFARSTGVVYFAQCADTTIENCNVLNTALNIVTCKNTTIKNHNHVDRYMGTTNTTGIYAINVSASSDNTVIDGVIFGYGGEIPNVHPYLGVVSYGQSSNTKIRNIGSRTSFLNGGSANNPAYIVNDLGNNDAAKLQRLYMAPTRTGAIGTNNSSKNIEIEHVYGDMGDSIFITSLNTRVKNCGGTNTTTGQASVYGTHFWDAFTSDTVGRIILSFNEPTAETAGYVTTSIGATSGFTSVGDLSLAELNDEVIIEQDYFTKAVTALPSTAPVITGTNVTYSSGARWGNHDIYFQIDKGSGFNGSWLDLTGDNLLAQSSGIDPSIGIRLKYRIVCAVANTGNLLTYIRIATTSTLVAQTNNLYPLDTTTLSLTGLQVGSDVVILQASTETQLEDAQSINSSTYNYVYSTQQAVDIGVFKEGYVPFYIRGYSLGATNASLPIAQVVDRNFA